MVITGQKTLLIYFLIIKVIISQLLKTFIIMNKVVKRVISICGGQKELANACGVSQVAIVKWLKGGGISAKYVPLISQATEGQVSIEEICQSCLVLSKLKGKEDNGSQ